MTFNWSHGATDAETTSVAIVPVDQDQSAELATYSQRIYSQHYEYLWLEGGSEWYREKVFGADQLATEIRDPRIAHYFICVEGRRVGFLRLVLSSDLPGQPGGMELSRLYLDETFCGRGLGRQDVDEVRAVG